MLLWLKFPFFTLSGNCCFEGCACSAHNTWRASQALQVQRSSSFGSEPGRDGREATGRTGDRELWFHPGERHDGKWRIHPYDSGSSSLWYSNASKAKNGHSFSHISTFKPIQQIWADITPSITISAFSTIAVIYKLPLEISSCAKCSITWKSLDCVEITIWLIQSSWSSVTLYSVSNYSDGMKEALCHESVIFAVPITSPADVPASQ